MSNRRWLIITALIFSIASLSAVAVVQGKKIFSRKAIEASPTTQRTPSSQETQNRGDITLAAVGDIMLGSTWPDASGLPPNDGADLLSEVAPILEAADLTFGNLEGPMIDGGTSAKCPPGKANCYAFRVPTRYGKYLKEAGFDVMSLANNHALDFGFEGRASSKRVLDSLGIGHSGEVGDIARLTVKGKRIAVIAFATYGNSYNLNNLETAKRVVSDLVAKNDLVIVSFHGGAEGASRQRVPRGIEVFFGENRGDLRKFTHAMIDIGADLIIGHGPHVIRGMEVYKDRLIAYSLGNFATYGRFNLTGPLGLALILEVKLAPDGKFLGGTLHPAIQVKPGGPRLDPDGTVIPVVRELSEFDFGESAVRVSDDGKISPP